MDTSYCNEHPKKQEDVARRNQVKEKEEGSGSSSTDSANSFWTRLPNLCTAWMGPLVRVTYSGLTQSVLRLGRVKPSSCDCPGKIHVDVDSNVRCFTSFSSGSSSPEVAEFVRLCAWSILSLGPKYLLVHYPAFIVFLAKKLFKK
jgi:hypothetical protein